MPYQTQIPDDFVAPQYRDETFNKALALYAAKNKPGAQWVCAIPRPDLDPTSRARFDFGSHVEYKLGVKENQVAVMQVIGVGAGRVRLGYRENMPVSVGDTVLINLREAGTWQVIGGQMTYWFTAEICMVRMYRTTKPVTPPLDPEARLAWSDECFWNIRDVLNDYVLLGNDPNTARYMRNGPESLIELSQQTLNDGTRADSARDQRFPTVYRRVLGAGPGRTFRRESDLGLIERVETIPEVAPGDMMSYSKTLSAASFTFQGMPLEVIHCASVMNIEHGNATALATGAPQTSVHESVPKLIPWDEPNEIDDEEDAALRGEIA